MIKESDDMGNDIIMPDIMVRMEHEEMTEGEVKPAVKGCGGK